MLTRVLGRSGIEVSAMGMGCWAIGGPWTIDNGVDEPFAAGWGEVDDAESVRAIHAAMDLGVTLFDTAANYGAGHSERVLGKALTGRRDHALIATKFGYVIDEERRCVEQDDAAVVANLRQDCENSLRRLNTDYIDLYQTHRPALDVPLDETLGALTDLVRQGKVRYIGSSTAPAWHVMEALMVSELKGLARFVTEQPPYNLLDRRIENELVPLCQRHGLGIIGIPW